MTYLFDADVKGIGRRADGLFGLSRHGTEGRGLNRDLFGSLVHAHQVDEHSFFWHVRTVDELLNRSPAE